MEGATYLNGEKGMENKGKIAEFERAVLKIAEEFKKRNERIKELEEALKKEEKIMKAIDERSYTEFGNAILRIAEEIKRRDIFIREIQDSLAYRDQCIKALDGIARLEMGDIEGINARIGELQGTLTKLEDAEDKAEMEKTDAINSAAESEGDVKKGKFGRMFGWLSSGKSEQAEKRDARMESVAAIREKISEGPSMEKSGSDDGKEKISKADEIVSEEHVPKVKEEKFQALQDGIKAVEAKIEKLEARLLKGDEQLKRLEELLQGYIEIADERVQVTSSIEDIPQPKTKEEAGPSEPSIEDQDIVPYDNILGLFKKHGELTVQEVEEDLGINHTKVYYTLRKLMENGKISEINKGKYQYIGD